METFRFDATSAEIRFSLNELVIINNALNEVCNALDQFEFQTRMGAEHIEVDDLLRQINDVISLIEKNI